MELPAPTQPPSQQADTHAPLQQLQSDEPPPHKKRNAYTAHDKLKAIRMLEKTGSIRVTIDSMFHDLAPAFYDSRRKLILGWRDRREQIEIECSSSRKAMRKKARPQGVTTALPREAEEELLVWVNELREEGVPVSTLMLRLEAIDIGEEHGVTGFAASWCWRQRFMERNKLSLRLRTRQGQHTPAALDETAAAFAEQVSKTMEDLGISVAYNADQTGTFYSIYVHFHLLQSLN